MVKPKYKKNQYTIPGTRRGKFLTRSTPAVREEAFSSHVQCKKNFQGKNSYELHECKIRRYESLQYKLTLVPVFIQISKTLQNF